MAGTPRQPRAPRTPGAPVQPAHETQQADAADLPNAIDIDARSITAPVLTRQGWVVPDEAHLLAQRKLAEAKATLGIAG